jgi:hypothetical protein
MTLQPAAEASAVDKPARATKPAARKRTAAAPKTTPRTRKTAPKPAATPLVAVTGKEPRHDLGAIAGFGLVLAAAVAGATMLVVDRSADTPAPDSGDAVAVSAAELASFAGSHASTVYWAGPLPARTLELTRTDAGTFVRYLPAGTAVGGSSRALTIATYPHRDAYETVAGRAKAAGMSSSPTRNGGLAVWSKAQPTSIYVAYRGVPSLIEVYAPEAQEARALALSGQLRLVH